MVRWWSVVHAAGEGSRSGGSPLGPSWVGELRFRETQYDLIGSRGDLALRGRVPIRSKRTNLCGHAVFLARSPALGSSMPFPTRGPCLAPTPRSRSIESLRLLIGRMERRLSHSLTCITREASSTTSSAWCTVSPPSVYVNQPHSRPGPLS